MRSWQEEYVGNVKEIAAIRQLFSGEAAGFDAWYEAHRKREERLKVLRTRNAELLSDKLFPFLDALGGASEAEIRDLEAFSDCLMDWKTNLDCGVYAAIHEALLRLCRLRRDRDGIIRELYKLGMGTFYLDRALVGIEGREADSIRFQGEMLFTEAASYFRHFEQIGNEETKGYIIRSMANICLFVSDFKKKLNTTAKAIRVIRQPEVRAMAPGLPWDVYLRRSHQQMSTYRSGMDSRDITREEMATVMDSCYEVFKPEQQAKDPSVRWQWPYYDMEFQCGYVGLEETADRLEKLIDDMPADRFDQTGLYSNVHLPIFYGRMMRKHEKMNRDTDRRRFLNRAYRKMLRVLMTIPPECCNDDLYYSLRMAVSDFYEIPEAVSYRELSGRIMQRFAGRLYLRSLSAGELLAAFAAYILRFRGDYFSDIPFLQAIGDGEEREAALLRYARECGLYYDFGLLKMDMERTMQSRPLFESENRMFSLHTLSGYEDLRARASTEIYADIARGHHSSYSGAEEDPSGYVRIDSPYRRMTDLVALISDLMEREDGDIRAWARRVNGPEKHRFSPAAAAFLLDEELQNRFESILQAGGRERCRMAYESFYGETAAPRQN